MNNARLLAGVAMVMCLATAPAAPARDSDAQSVQTAKISLSDAIMKAQKRTHGRAIFAKYETSGGVANYVVTIVAPGGKKDTLNVDPQTGESTKRAQENSGSSSEGDAQTIAQANVGLTRAIRIAEQAQGGKATRATLDTDKGKTAYKVELANGDKTLIAWVDANSGRVVDTARPSMVPGLPGVFQ